MVCHVAVMQLNIVFKLFAYRIETVKLLRSEVMAEELLDAF